MILRGAEAARYAARPDPDRAGLLLFGADAMRVALKRQDAIAALIGPDGEAEMRLTRIAASDLRRDPSLLIDAQRATGFFPGPRVVFVEDATDGLTATVAEALAGWQKGDAVLVAAAGNLQAKSSLRGLFEKHPKAVSIALYDDPLTRDEIESELARAGLTRIDRVAMEDLAGLARALDPGDFRQTLQRIGLYKWGDPSPLTPAEVATLAPATIEAAMDDLLHAVAEGQDHALGPLLRRLENQGELPVTLCIMALRHFRALHTAKADPGGIGSGLQRARVFGPRRDRMQRQAQTWSMTALEGALATLVDTDLMLRSSSRAPLAAVMERALIRICRQPRTDRP